MPAMTMLRWFHTIMGVLALLLATAAIRNHSFIRSTDREGGAYLVVTVVVAGSALGIYNQGGFGVAHYLAVLTLAAAFGGFVIQRLNLFGRFSVYFQAIAYSATILCHMIPATTDSLGRLPVGDPFIDSLDSPVLQGFHLAFLGLCGLGVAAQILKLQRRAADL